MSCPGTLWCVFEVRLTVEIYWREPVVGIHKQVKRHNRLVIVAFHDHAAMRPMPDIDDIGQHLSQRIPGQNQLACIARTLSDVGVEEKALWNVVLAKLRDERSMLLNVFPRLLHVPFVALEQFKVSQQYIGIAVKTDVLTPVRVLLTCRQLDAVIHHEPQCDGCACPLSLMVHILTAFPELAFDVEL